jgi:recombination protein RecT
MTETKPPLPGALGKSVTPLDEVKSNIKALAPELTKVLPPQIPVERFIRVVITAIANEPKLVECHRATLFTACLKAAGDGLLPDGREGAIVPYREKGGGFRAQWMPMIRGLFKLARQGGVTSPFAYVVHENDEFEFFVDTQNQDAIRVRHVPLLDSTKRGEPILAYAFAKVEGEPEVEVMLKEDILAVRNVSKAQSGPWESPFSEEMWKKTVFRRLSKRLPLSPELERALGQEDEENFNFKTAKDVTAAEPENDKVTIETGRQNGKMSRLKSLLPTADEVEGAAGSVPAEEEAKA